MFTLFDAAQYSLAPHRLGLCGPGYDCSKIFRSRNKSEIKRTLSKFKAVIYYCRQIAKANQLADPLSTKVLEAYWLGNDLLIKARYPNGGYPHHSYHVFCAKPFNPQIKLNDKLKKICQITAKKIGAHYYAYHWKTRVQKINQTQLQNLRYYNKINQCLSQKLHSSR